MIYCFIIILCLQLRKLDDYKMFKETKGVCLTEFIKGNVDEIRRKRGKNRI